MTTLFTNLYSFFEDCVKGLAKRNGGVGCVCYWFGVPDTKVHVTIFK